MATPLTTVYPPRTWDTFCWSLKTLGLNNWINTSPTDHRQCLSICAVLIIFNYDIFEVLILTYLNYDCELCACLLPYSCCLMASWPFLAESTSSAACAKAAVVSGRLWRRCAARLPVEDLSAMHLGDTWWYLVIPKWYIIRPNDNSCFIPKLGILPSNDECT